MPIVPIDSITDPRVADYVQVREAELRKERFDAPGGLFVAEGELVVRRLFQSRYRVRSLLVTQARLNTLNDLVERLPADVPVYLVNQATMNGVVGFNIHRGVLAIGERGPEPSLDELAAGARCLVVLEDLVNHDNLGGVFRNVAGLGGGCFGHTRVVLSPKCADPLYRKSIRVSMGSALLVPFVRAVEWPRDLDRLKVFGFHIVALSPGDRSVEIGDFSTQMAAKTDKIALVLGSEGPGLHPDSLAMADTVVRIDMPGRTSPSSGSPVPNSLDTDFVESQGIDSLNVSVAGAIALHRLFPLCTSAQTD